MGEGEVDGEGEDEQSAAEDTGDGRAAVSA